MGAVRLSAEFACWRENNQATPHRAQDARCTRVFQPARSSGGARPPAGLHSGMFAADNGPHYGQSLAGLQAPLFAVRLCDFDDTARRGVCQ
jgi:hypothetical protein